jgi:hypothetical protein
MRTAQLFTSLLTVTLLSSGVLGATATPQVAPAEASEPAELRLLTFGNPAQDEFKKAYLSHNYPAALSAWPQAYASTPFADTATGYAFYSYLLFKADIRVTALEHLFLVKNPAQIAGPVRQLWRDAAPPSHDVWKLAHLRWTSAWTQVFAGFSGRESVPFQPANITKATQLKGLEQALARSTPNTNERAWAQWQLSLWAAIHDQTALAKNQIDALLNSKQTLFGKDQLHVAKARILFQEADLKGALNEYQMISRSSDYWLETLEERAWTYMRLGQPDKSLGELKTLLSPVFTPQVGPEPFFLQAFINLKICDFSQIFKTLDDFKARFRVRAALIQKLAKNGKTPEAEQAIAKLDHTALAWNSVGVNSSALPRYFHRDEVIATEMGIRQNLLSDAETLKNLNQRSPGILNGSSTAARNINILLNQAPTRADQARTRVFQRLQVLAEGEVDEISLILQKMHIIEAEAIERMHLVKKEQLSKGNTKAAIAHSDDDLVFPVNDKDDKELWIDELDNYHYQVKGCPNQGGKTL